MIHPPWPVRATNATPSPWRLHATMLVAAFLVATSFPVGKALTPFMEPTLLTLIRFALATALFAPCVFRTNRPSLPGPRRLAQYSLISATLAGFFVLMFSALRTTTPFNTGILFTTVPGLAGLYSWCLLGEQLRSSQLAALLLAMIGAVWVIAEGDLQRLFQLQPHRGDLLFCAGCLLMALYMPLVKIFHRGEPMMFMTFWVLATGTCWLLIAVLLQRPAIDWAGVPFRVWIGIGYLTVFTTIVTFFLSQWATIYLGPTRVTAYSYLYPPFILLIEWQLHQSIPSPHALLGVLLILPAMFLVQKSTGSARKSG